jgi:acyl-coenzyme A thioesterase PaaI-like protein
MTDLISVDRFNHLLAETTPIAAYLDIRANRIEDGEAWARIGFSKAALRAGGTHSGPALMALIDVCMYAALLGAIGDDPRPLTTNIAVNFLNRPPARALIAHCKLLRRDCDFAVGSIVVYPEDEEANAICTSTCTYALPAARRELQPEAPSRRAAKMPGPQNDKHGR